MRRPSIASSEKAAVEDLYYGELMNAPEIASRYGVSVDAVYSFMRRHKLLRRPSAYSNKIEYERRELSFKYTLPDGASNKGLEIAGSMLYWAEGCKSDKTATVDFANSDPDMIRVFLRFFAERFAVTESKLRVYLYAYANQDVASIMDYWIKVTNIPKEQFLKPYIRHDFNVKQTRIMRYGLVHVRYNDKKLLSEIKKMIHSHVLLFANAPVG